ncbi:response regulator [Pseudodesulfovibrio indicus]|uniref:response regulator n=1 Tax=Pseudodesulfovibrio indicus TaxID=1716143 RepID=UPI00292FFEFD|nr:response regulator [Pseudodesulfovibrio indicus]
MKTFGNFIRDKRLELFEGDKAYSLRQVSQRIGVEPSYLSKIERGLPVTLSEEKIVSLAGELGIDADYLLALGGKISDDVQRIIKNRPELFARIVREMQRMPDAVIEEKTFFQSMAANLARLHDLASIGAFRFPANGKAAFWTEQVPRILGLAPDTPPSLAAIGSGLAAESAERLLRVTGEHLSGYGAYRCEVRTLTEPPATLLVWGCAEDTGAGPVHLGIVQDVTDYAALRDEIRSARDELQLKVDEQHSEIAASIRKLNEEIRRRHLLEINLQVVNRKIARQAKDQKQFFREHAFQLRSLMTRLSPAWDGAPGGNEMKPTIDRILPKIDDLGDFLSDPDALTPALADTDVRRVLEDVNSAFAADAQGAGLSLITAVSPALPALVRTDERRLRQILTALMELFVANTEWGAVQLSASVSSEPKARLVLSLSAPSAKGPVDQALSSILHGDDDCRQAQSGPVRMVAPLTRLLGGELSATHAPGAGGSVVLSLPFTECAGQEPPADTGHRAGRTALIVEDTIYSRLFACRAMEQGGFEVAEAMNGAEAEALLCKQRFDVILLDIQLPDVDGTELARALRADPESPNRETPVIAVTAHADVADQEEFLRSGIDGIVTKPYEMEDLVAEVARLLADRPQS